MLLRKPKIRAVFTLFLVPLFCDPVSTSAQALPGGGEHEIRIGGGLRLSFEDCYEEPAGFYCRFLLAADSDVAPGSVSLTAILDHGEGRLTRAHSVRFGRGEGEEARPFSMARDRYWLEMTGIDTEIRPLEVHFRTGKAFPVYRVCGFSRCQSLVTEKGPRQVLYESEKPGLRSGMLTLNFKVQDSEGETVEVEFF